MILYAFYYFCVVCVFILTSFIYNYYKRKQIYLEQLIGIVLYSIFWPLTVLGFIVVGIIRAVIHVVDFFRNLKK